MQNWKRALVFGSLGASAFLLFTGRRPAAIALATAGLVVLASEYPERFEELWESAPEYLDKGAKILNTLTRIGERLAEEGSRRGSGALREISDYVS